MADSKKSFVLYADLIKIVEQLPDEIAGKLFKIVLRYVNDIEICVDDLLLKIAFEPIKLQLQRDLQKWDVIKEKRSQAGIKSAEARKKEKINQESLTNSTHVESVEQTPTNSTVNDTVTVNVNDTVTVINKKENGDKRFAPPSLLEVQNYITEKKYGVNAHAFWNFYESKNWYVGKNKMKDWKKALGGWEARNSEQNGKSTSNSTGRAPDKISGRSTLSAGADDYQEFA